MNACKGLLVLLVIFLMTASAQARWTPQDPGTQSAEDRLNNAAKALQETSRIRVRVAEGDNLVFFSQEPGLRGRGGRGAAPGQEGQRGGAAALPVVQTVNGAWWTNTALVARLGLTDDQKARIERAFENHREKIVSSTQQLEKEEAQLARLLEAETIDRNAILTQIDRVTEARGEMERTNAAMTLEMREQLTRAQWMQLPPQSNQRAVRIVMPGLVPPPGGPGARGGQRTGGRGQQ